MGRRGQERGINSFWRAVQPLSRLSISQAWETGRLEKELPRSRATSSCAQPPLVVGCDEERGWGRRAAPAVRREAEWRAWWEHTL